MSEADAVYMPTDQSWFADNVLSFVVRTRGDAAALTPAVKRAIWSVDKVTRSWPRFLADLQAGARDLRPRLRVRRRVGALDGPDGLGP